MTRSKKPPPEQMSLFDAPAKREWDPRSPDYRPLWEPRPPASEEAARDAGIDQALGGTPAGWQVDAVNAVRAVAWRQAYFDADDVWEQLTAMGARTPATKAALAGVLRQCAGRSVAWIEATDRSTKSEGEGRHASRIMVWRSRLYPHPKGD
jgi:hypothetical protein